MEDRYTLTEIEEVAERTGLHAQTIRRMARDDKFPEVLKTSGRKLHVYGTYFLTHEIDAWFRAREDGIKMLTTGVRATRRDMAELEERLA